MKGIYAMKKVWKQLSHLGLKGHEEGLRQLTVILTNQINVMILVIMLFVFITVRIFSIYDNGNFGMGSVRVLWMIALSIVNLLFSRIGKPNLAKFSLILVSPIVFLIYPIFTGFVEEESYTYYPYVIIALSIIPQMILIPTVQRTVFRLVILYYFVLLLAIEPLMVHFGPNDLDMVGLVKEFFVFYKIAQIAIFCFVQGSVFYLRKLNTEYEQRVQSKEMLLDSQFKQLKKTVDDLRLAQEQLLQSEKMAALGTLTAGVAHEINNPLNYISGGAMVIRNLIEDYKGNDSKHIFNNIEENLEVIEEGLSKVNDILGSLMVFSYQGKSKKANEDVHNIIESVLTILNAKIKNDIQLKKDYSLNFLVPLFKEKLHQVFVNIIDNAIYALREKGEERNIKIETSSEYYQNDNYALIKISNNGPAISDEELPKVFDPFYTTKGVGKGTGLGLSISYNLVMEHGGAIEVANEEGWVCFSIYLPFSQNLTLVDKKLNKSKRGL